MEEIEFEKLLAAYFGNTLTDDEIIKLKEAVEGNAIYAQRFREHVRMHSLVRELAHEQAEQRKSIFFRKAILAAAAVITVALGIGFAFSLRVQEQQTAIAVTQGSFAEGTAQIFRDGRPIDLVEGLELLPGDRLLNKDGASTSFEMSDGSRVELFEETELVLSSGDEQFALARGEVSIEVPKRAPEASPFSVSTPDSTVTVLGTIFDLEYVSGNTRLSVIEGEVVLKRATDGEEILVSGGQFVDTSERDMRPQKLLRSIIIDPMLDITRRGEDLRNMRTLRVGGSTTSYIKFQISGIRDAKRAVLNLTGAKLPGEGELTIQLGSDSSWTEDTDAALLPGPIKIIGREYIRATDGASIQVPLEPVFERGKIYTLILSLDSEKEVAFDSLVTSDPPYLELSE
ncbi:MAG: FecR family protein [Opitutales bacterium]